MQHLWRWEKHVDKLWIRVAAGVCKRILINFC